MEVVSNKLDKNRQINDSNSLYKQNNYNKFGCNFENKDQTYKEKSNTLLIPNNFVEIEYTHPKPSFIDENENMSIPNTEGLLVNTNNIEIETSMIPASTKYSRQNDLEINFDRKYFDNITDTNPLSVTQSDTYASKKFWQEILPEITTNNNFLHKIVDINHLKDRDNLKEEFNQDFNLEYDRTLNMNRNMHYHKHPNKSIIREEPRLSPNYVTNYTEKDNKIVHHGQAYNSHKNMYQQTDKIYNTDKSFGQLNYYNEGWLNSFNKEFSLNQKKYNLIDPNQNNYDKHVCNSEQLYPKKKDNCDKEDAYVIKEGYGYVQVKNELEPVVEKVRQDNFKKDKNCDNLYKNMNNVYNDVSCDYVERNAHEYNIMTKRKENMLASFNKKENQRRNVNSYIN